MLTKNKQYVLYNVRSRRRARRSSRKYTRVERWQDVSGSMCRRRDKAGFVMAMRNDQRTAYMDRKNAYSHEPINLAGDKDGKLLHLGSQPRESITLPPDPPSSQKNNSRISRESAIFNRTKKFSNSHRGSESARLSKKRKRKDETGETCFEVTDVAVGRKGINTEFLKDFPPMVFFFTLPLFSLPSKKLLPSFNRFPFSAFSLLKNSPLLMIMSITTSFWDVRDASGAHTESGY